MKPGSQSAADEHEILDQLKRLATEELNMPAERVAGIRAETKIQEGMELDSLAQVVLVAGIERKFGCAFEFEQWQGLETVGDLVRLIAEHVRRPVGT